MSARQGKRLRSWRVRCGLTQQGAAERVGTTQKKWSELENGKATPSLAEGLAIDKVTLGEVKAGGWVPPRSAGASDVRRNGTDG